MLQAATGLTRTHYNIEIEHWLHRRVDHPGSDLVELIKQAGLQAPIEVGAACIRSGHLLWALLADKLSARRLGPVSDDAERLSTTSLKQDFAALMAGSATPEATGTVAPRPGGALKQLSVNLTQPARAGTIGPIPGRDEGIRRGTESASGARNVEIILSRTPLSMLLTRVREYLAGGAPLQPVHAGVDRDAGFVFAVR